jgi:hypothetical protein
MWLVVNGYLAPATRSLPHLVTRSLHQKIKGAGNNLMNLILVLKRRRCWIVKGTLSQNFHMVCIV